MSEASEALRVEISGETGRAMRWLIYKKTEKPWRKNRVVIKYALKNQLGKVYKKLRIL